jgi:tetratricopeptide (TPR) repeat protein
MILKKPYGFSEALAMIIGAVADRRSTKNISNAFAAFKLAVATGDADKATLERQKIVTHPSITKDLAAITDAEWYFAIGDYENAKKIAINPMPKESPYFPQMLAVLGKSLIKLGDFKAANDVLTKSMEASPLNLDRAAGLVQAKAGLGDKAGVMAGVNVLMAIDGAHPKVAETLKLAKDKLSKLGASDLGAIESIVAGSSASGLAVTSYHNNLGVAMAKNGRFEDSIFHYLLAAEAAKDKAVPPGIRSMILYNLGLTMTKSGSYVDAFATLKKAVVDADKSAPIMAKIESLALKLDEAIKNNKKVVINENKGGPNESTASKVAPSAIKQIRCLLGIYTPANKKFSEVGRTAALIPTRFVRRTAIVKEDIFPSKAASNG